MDKRVRLTGESPKSPAKARNSPQARFATASAGCFRSRTAPVGFPLEKIGSLKIAPSVAI